LKEILPEISGTKHRENGRKMKQQRKKREIPTKIDESARNTPMHISITLYGVFFSVPYEVYMRLYSNSNQLDVVIFKSTLFKFI